MDADVTDAYGVVAEPDPVSWSVAVASASECQMNAVMAQQLAAIADTLDYARQHPSTFCGVGSGSGPEATEFAVTAAVADLATALHVSEGTIRVRAGHAATLIGRMPRLWGAFLSGDTSYQHVRVVLDAAIGLSGDPATWATYDDALADAATWVTAGVLRVRARKLRERLDVEPLQVRHNRARRERRTWVEADADGMAFLGAYLPADAAFRADARLTGTARSLKALPGEIRTLAQVKADVLADLLTGDGTPYAVKTSLGLTLPMLNLFGHDSDGDEPATLDGMIPVDPETAKRLVVNAPSFHRVLTDPVSGTILDVDRRAYRVPADLKRLIRITRPVCAFPGCLRRAAETDTDHTTDWVLRGVTADHNLQPVCRKHHRMKHRTAWHVHNPDVTGTPAGRPTMAAPPQTAGLDSMRVASAQHPGRASVRSRWTSPTGRIHDSDPPF